MCRVEFARLMPTWLLRKIVYWAFNRGYLEVKRRCAARVIEEYFNG
jgi:hypothetical protein